MPRAPSPLPPRISRLAVLHDLRPLLPLLPLRGKPRHIKADHLRRLRRLASLAALAMLLVSMMPGPSIGTSTTSRAMVILPTPSPIWTESSPPSSPPGQDVTPATVKVIQPPPGPPPPTPSQAWPKLARYLRQNYPAPQYGGVFDAQVWALHEIGRQQFACLWSIANGESRWNPYNRNPHGGAYGIPQAFPASRMASAGSDWQTNPLTQVRWMVGYVKHRYGSACAARAFRKAKGWY